MSVCPCGPRSLQLIFSVVISSQRSALTCQDRNPSPSFSHRFFFFFLASNLKRHEAQALQAVGDKTADIIIF